MVRRGSVVTSVSENSTHSIGLGTGGMINLLKGSVLGQIDRKTARRPSLDIREAVVFRTIVADDHLVIRIVNPVNGFETFDEVSPTLGEVRNNDVDPLGHLNPITSVYTSHTFLVCVSRANVSSTRFLPFRPIWSARSGFLSR